MNYHNYAISDAVFITILFIWPASPAPSIAPLPLLLSISSIQLPLLKRGRAELVRIRRGMASDATANVNGTSFLSRWWGHARKRKRRMRRRFETRGFVDGRAEARDCCASICNSRSICKRQRNLNRETRNGCLYLARREPSEFARRVGLIYTGNKNYRSLETSRVRAVLF